MTTARERTIRNRSSSRWLALTIVVFGLAWVAVSYGVASVVAAPMPWTSIGVLVLFGGGVMLASAKTPLSLEFEDGRLILRHLIRRRKIRRDLITHIEYRILSTYVDRPVEARYYGVSMWTGYHRIADIGVDGLVAQRLKEWFGSERSVLKVLRGRVPIEERPVEI